MSSIGESRQDNAKSINDALEIGDVKSLTNLRDRLASTKKLPKIKIPSQEEQQVLERLMLHLTTTRREVASLCHEILTLWLCFPLPAPCCTSAYDYGCKQEEKTIEEGSSLLKMSHIECIRLDALTSAIQRSCFPFLIRSLHTQDLPSLSTIARLILSPPRKHNDFAHAAVIECIDLEYAEALEVLCKELELQLNFVFRKESGRIPHGRGSSVYYISHTPLTYAATYGKYNVIPTLIKLGADTTYGSNQYLDSTNKNDVKLHEQVLDMIDHKRYQEWLVQREKKSFNYLSEKDTRPESSGDELDPNAVGNKAETDNDGKEHDTYDVDNVRKLVYHCGNMDLTFAAVKRGMDYYREAFLMGAHPRLGEHSPFRHFAMDKFADFQVLSVIFDMCGWVLPKEKKIRSEAARRSLDTLVTKNARKQQQADRRKAKKERNEERRRRRSVHKLKQELQKQRSKSRSRSRSRRRSRSRSRGNSEPGTPRADYKDSGFDDGV